MKIENFNEPNSHEIVWLFAKDTSRSRMYMLAPDEFNLFRRAHHPMWSYPQAEVSGKGR